MPPDTDSPPPSPRRAVVRGSTWTAVGWVVSLVTGLPLSVVLVRVMARPEYGRLAIATAIAGLVIPFAGAGLRTAVAQVGASSMALHGEGGLDAALNSAKRIGVYAALATVPIWGLILVGMDADIHLRGAIPATAVLLPIVIASPLLGIGTGMLQSTNQPRRLAIAVSVTSGAGAVLVLTVLLAGARSAVAVAAARAVGVLCGAGVFLLLLSRNRRPVDKRVPIDTRTMLQFGVASVAALLAETAISQLDVAVLGALRGSRTAALYAPASRMADLVMTVPALVGGFLLPTMARLVSRGARRDVADLYHWASRWTLVVSAVPLGMMMASPRALLRTLFGRPYSGASTVLIVLGVGVAINVILGFNGLALDAHGWPTVVRSAGLFSVGVSAVACLVLIAWFGRLGAAVATTTALTLINIWCTVALYRRARILPWDSGLLWTVCSFVGAIVVVAVTVGSRRADAMTCVISGAAVGGVTLVASLVAGTGAELEALRRVLKKPRRTA